MQITEEQLSNIMYALTLGDYFVEGQDPTGTQYEQDADTMCKAWATIALIETTQQT